MGWPAHCICLQMLPPAARAVITPIGILFQPNRAPPSTFGRQCHHQCMVGSRRTAPAQLADGASGGLGCGSLAQLTLPGLAPRSLLVQLRQRWLETTDSTRRGNAFLNPVRHGYQHPPGLCPPEPQAGQAAVIGSGTSAAAPSRYSGVTVRVAFRKEAHRVNSIDHVYGTERRVFVDDMEIFFDIMVISWIATQEIWR